MLVPGNHEHGFSFFSAMASKQAVDYSDPAACRVEKDIHDACFYKWYKEDFLEGKKTELGCEDEWTTYQACVKVCQPLDRSTKKVYFHCIL